MFNKFAKPPYSAVEKGTRLKQCMGLGSWDDCHGAFYYLARMEQMLLNPFSIVPVYLKHKFLFLNYPKY